MTNIYQRASKSLPRSSKSNIWCSMWCWLGDFSLPKHGIKDAFLPRGGAWLRHCRCCEGWNFDVWSDLTGMSTRALYIVQTRLVVLFGQGDVVVDWGCSRGPAEKEINSRKLSGKSRSNNQTQCWQLVLRCLIFYAELNTVVQPNISPCLY